MSGWLNCRTAYCRSHCSVSPPSFALHPAPTGGCYGYGASHFGSQIGDMCGNLRWNFEEILSLPEQTTAHRHSRWKVAARVKLNKVASPLC